MDRLRQRRRLVMFQFQRQRQCQRCPQCTRQNTLKRSAPWGHTLLLPLRHWTPLITQLLKTLLLNQCLPRLRCPSARAERQSFCHTRVQWRLSALRSCRSRNQIFHPWCRRSQTSHGRSIQGQASYHLRLRVHSKTLTCKQPRIDLLAMIFIRMLLIGPTQAMNKPA